MMRLSVVGANGIPSAAFPLTAQKASTQSSAHQARVDFRKCKSVPLEIQAP